MVDASSSFGERLREWRQRRHLSQLGLAAEAEISQRHLSFLESGRSAPSRDMVLRLAERLEVPLRQRNALLAAAGFAPVFGERGLDDPGLAAARGAVEAILEGHAPHPALAIDRHWVMVAANRVVPLLLEGVAPELLRPPVNVLRLSLHPEGLAPRIGNYREWRGHLVERLARQVEVSADPVLIALLAELEAFPVPPGARPHRRGGPDRFGGVAVPLELRAGDATLAFLSATTVFGSALDITLAELAVESFFPADPATAAFMRRLCGEPAGEAGG